MGAKWKQWSRRAAGPGEEAGGGDGRGKKASIWQRVSKWARADGGKTCKIWNETGKEVVVCAKYGEVWEGQHWRLPAHAGHMLVPSRFLPDHSAAQPFNRLAAFLASPHPSPLSFVSDPLPLIIPSLHFLHHRHLALSLHPSFSSSLVIHPVARG
ncbi:hypothetical protein L7F22_021963 [Adiantum nelumboides]|nr:hypothetical protein [Adiantum nelumboides]